MSKQLNVRQQNAQTKAEIAHVASAVSPSLSWLPVLLRSNGLEPQSGLLVRLSEVPEQDGNFFRGIWLTDQLTFWEFEVTVHRTTKELIEVERFNDVSPTLPVVAALKGTGASFAYLAQQVLHEVRCA